MEYFRGENPTVKWKLGIAWKVSESIARNANKKKRSKGSCQTILEPDFQPLCLPACLNAPPQIVLLTTEVSQLISVLLTLSHVNLVTIELSSLRAKRRGPKGLCAESARAVTGRPCPHSGEGEDFLMGQLIFFYENCCNSATESRKIDPKVEN